MRDPFTLGPTQMTKRTIASRRARVAWRPSWSRRTLLTLFRTTGVSLAGCQAADERFGAPLFLARTRAGRARALIARARPEDLDHARQLLAAADEAAGRLGAEGIAREVAECRAALAAMSG